MPPACAEVAVMLLAVVVVTVGALTDPPVHVSGIVCQDPTELSRNTKVSLLAPVDVGVQVRLTAQLAPPAIGDVHVFDVSANCVPVRKKGATT